MIKRASYLASLPQFLPHWGPHTTQKHEMLSERWICQGAWVAQTPDSWFQLRSKSQPHVRLYPSCPCWCSLPLSLNIYIYPYVQNLPLASQSKKQIPYNGSQHPISFGALPLLASSATISLILSSFHTDLLTGSLIRLTCTCFMAVKGQARKLAVPSAWSSFS